MVVMVFVAVVAVFVTMAWRVADTREPIPPIELAPS